MALAGVAAAACSLVACSGQPPASTPSSTSPSSSGSSSAGLQSVTPAAVPHEPTAESRREALHPDPNFDFGWVVQITPQGFHPAVLVASCCLPVVWLNLTNKPNSIRFIALGNTSGPIPPGGSWTFVPHNAESVAYRSLTYPGMTGAVEVEATSEP